MQPGVHHTRINPEDAAENRLALQHENESAEILAKQGHHVEQNPSVPGPKNPDCRIEGEIFDCVSPGSRSARNVGSRIEEKILQGRTSRIVLNLAASPYRSRPSRPTSTTGRSKGAPAPRPRCRQNLAPDAEHPPDRAERGAPGPEVVPQDSPGRQLRLVR
ncbi:hypothetical protein AB0I39_33265 [Kitasatospora purpeofusca]|uniref:CdiA C-terminal domain-containing protein n=1 Tax=Kitasatospora purpeofusca TaxID=67352 RepID=UPI0033F75B32